ncbi:hypothetical protein K435DRAFT_787834 [Dendrothele bispora CBS 962.96]|uniref:Uncharacterized protein n=1 Tax=Dendrothele bispora (strain CBS 962.96) TaxID=1314807 RepID=A0A4S8MYT2_DENBC|nr:hypothetical protein K435DRAFT_787834 [Dendrothele bispora CBS 962.96]
MSSLASQRPGPLCDLPLDHFLPPDPNIPQNALPRPNKRPRSPDRPSLYSPTKRRILAEEGVSLEKTLKSPFRSRPIAAPIPLPGLLASPAAKKLDFGPTKKLSECLESNHRVPARITLPVCSLAPSHELEPRATPTKSAHREAVIGDDYFATPERISHPSTPRFIPRDPPAASDPRSIHYPGFKVYQDPYIVVAESLGIEVFTEKEKEDVKENLPPRKRSKKAVDVDSRTLLMTPEGKKRELEKILEAKATPATPKKTMARERHEVTSPTPRRPLTGHPRSAGGRTPVLTEEERKQRRRMLQDEVEEIGGFDDVDALL